MLRQQKKLPGLSFRIIWFVAQPKCTWTIKYCIHESLLCATLRGASGKNLNLSSPETHVIYFKKANTVCTFDYYIVYFISCNTAGSKGIYRTVLKRRPSYWYNWGHCAPARHCSNTKTRKIRGCLKGMAQWHCSF